MLALHPELQRKVFDEVALALPGDISVGTAYGDVNQKLVSLLILPRGVNHFLMSSLLQLFSHSQRLS